METIFPFQLMEEHSLRLSFLKTRRQKMFSLLQVLSLSEEKQKIEDNRPDWDEFRR